MNNILIIKPSALGDVATALPVLASLRSAFPDAKISWLVRTEFAPLLQMCPELDDIILFDRKRLGKWWYDPKVFSQLCAFVNDLRRRKFDLVIDLQGLFRTGFFAFITGSKKRYGLKKSRELASFFYTNKIAPDETSLHVIDQYLKVVTEVTSKDLSKTPGLMVSDEVKSKVLNLLEQHKILRGNYVVFVPTAAHSYKCWPKEKFAEVASKLISEFDSINVVAVGSANDAEYIDKMVSMEPSIINLAGITDIKRTCSIIEIR